MPMRLEKALAQIKQFQTDRLFNNTNSETELIALGKLVKILSLLREVQADFAEVDMAKGDSNERKKVSGL